jgi:hypothetical protein
MRITATAAATFALGISLAWTASAQAKTFEVTKSGDPVPGACKPNDCSLREAIRAANARPGSDKVLLPNRKNPYKLAQAGLLEDGALTGDLDVTNDALAIAHKGRGSATVDAQGIDRAFEVFDGSPVRFTKIRIRGGNDTTTNGGGGVRTDANATFVRSVLAGNSAAVADGIGGGIDGDSDSTLTFKRSRVTGNTAYEAGGGIASSIDGRLVLKRTKVTGNDVLDGSGGGVQMISAAGALIKQSTISGNEAASDSGGIHAVVNTTPSTLRIVSSTISGNEAGDDGGGMLVEDHALPIVNSTIADNTANDFGGGIDLFDGVDASLNAVTIARNRAAADDPGPVPSLGGGIYQIDSAVEVRNSLIGLNTIGIGGIQRNDCEGETFTSLGNNLLSTDVECDGFTAGGDIVRDNPKIGKLKKNGGSTKTVALKKDSPAINKAHGPSSPNRDQRGVKRKNPDIGAFERER